MIRSVLSFALALMLHASVAGAEGPRSLIQEADAAYAEAASRMSSDRGAAVDGFARSAELFRLGAAAMGHRSIPPALMYNIGNASLLAGEIGDAVLWYKRAERAAPNDADLRTNLAAAREKAGAAASVRPRDSMLDQLTIIEFVPPAVRFWLAVSGLTAMWALAMWRLFGTVSRPSRRGVAACAAVALLAGLSLLPREVRLREPTEAVVLRETTGRAGPDDTTYEAKPESALKPGTEVRVLEERGSWTLVELGDGTHSWVAAKDVERVAG